MCYRDIQDIAGCTFFSQRPFKMDCHEAPGRLDTETYLVLYVEDLDRLRITLIVWFSIRLRMFKRSATKTAARDTPRRTVWVRRGVEHARTMLASVFNIHQ